MGYVKQITLYNTTLSYHILKIGENGLFFLIFFVTNVLQLKKNYYIQ